MDPNLEAFLAKIADDAALQQRLRSAEADPVAIAMSVGITLDPDQLMAHRLDWVKRNPTRMLDDHELETVAAGAAVGGEEYVCLGQTCEMTLWWYES